MSYIRCLECSRTIGKYAEFVAMARLALMHTSLLNDKSEYKDYDPDKLLLKNDAVPRLDGILDAIYMDKPCCRTHLLTVYEFQKYE